MKTLTAEKLEKERERLSGMRLYENQCYEDGYAYVIGVDEVGRGPLCGPVVAGACVLPAACEILFLNDSKKLSEKTREELYDIISEKALAHGLGSVSAARIDEINILNATFEAMREAVSACLDALKVLDKEAALKTVVLVDGNHAIPALPLPQQAIVKGDSHSVSVAAASVLAKVTRDRLLRSYDSLYPGYGFAKNKGYGTKEHYEALLRLGLTPIHRKSFLKNLCSH